MQGGGEREVSKTASWYLDSATGWGVVAIIEYTPEEGLERKMRD